MHFFEAQKFSNKFTVEVWFSFTTNHCFKRNEKLYTDKGLVLDTDSSCIFEASSTKSSSSYFALNYDQCNDDWSVDHFRFDVVKTKDINFYNYYRNEEDLKALEDKSLFPPRFILSVQQKSICNNDLNLTIGIALLKKTLPTKSVSFKQGRRNRSGQSGHGLTSFGSSESVLTFNISFIEFVYKMESVFTFVSILFLLLCINK